MTVLPLNLSLMLEPFPCVKEMCRKQRCRFIPPIIFGEQLRTSMIERDPLEAVVEEMLDLWLQGVCLLPWALTSEEASVFHLFSADSLDLNPLKLD